MPPVRRFPFGGSDGFAVPPRVAVLAATFAILLSPGLPAQVRSLTGQVTTASGIPAPAAEVLVGGTSLRAVADSAGRYRITGAGTGPLILLVTSPGFAPAEVRVAASDEAETATNIELKPNSVVELPELRANAVTNRKLVDFSRRRRLGFGTFLGPDELAKRGAMHTPELLHGIPGVRITIDAPGGAYGESTVVLARCREGTSVWIDGQKLIPDPSGLYSRHGKATPAGVGEMLGRINPASIQAVEVYRGIAQIPGEFLDDSCAAIVLWTK